MRADGPAGAPAGPRPLVDAAAVFRPAASSAAIRRFSVSATLLALSTTTRPDWFEGGPV